MGTRLRASPLLGPRVLPRGVRRDAPADGGRAGGLAVSDHDPRVHPSARHQQRQPGRLAQRPYTFVHVSAGEFGNPVGPVITSAVVQVVYGFTTVVYAAAVTVVLFKISGFLIDADGHLRRVPLLQALQMSGLLFLHVSGIVHAGNIALAHGQGVLWPALLFFTYAEYGYLYVFRITGGLALLAANANANASVSRREIRTRKAMVSSAAIFAIPTLVLPMVFAAMGAIPLGVVATHAVLMAPNVVLSAMNTCSVRGVTRSLVGNAAKLNLPAEEKTKRVRFAWRYRIGATCGWIILVAHIVFVATQFVSPWASLLVRGIQCLATSVMSLFGAINLVHPRSITDKWAGCITRSATTGTTAGAPMKRVTVSAGLAGANSIPATSSSKPARTDSKRGSAAGH